MAEINKRKPDDTESPDTASKRAKSEDKKTDEKQESPVYAILYKHKPSYILHIPEDFAPDRFLSEHVGKYYVSADRSAIDAQKAFLRRECARNFFNWLLENKDKLKIRGKPKEDKTFGSRFVISIKPLDSECHIPSFKTLKGAESFARFIRKVKNGKLTQFDNSLVDKCCAYLRPGLYIEDATEIVVDSS